MTKQKFFRKPKTGEQIEYPCGCVYEIIVHRQGKLEFINETFCFEHDPTLTEYGREHEDEIQEAEQ